MDLFKTLKELEPLLSLKNTDNTRHLESEAFKKSESYKLLTGIKKGEITSEEEAIYSIYGDTDGARGNYRVLANKTLSIFIGNLFLKPTERKLDYKSIYQECHKKALTVTLLRSEGRQSAALYIALQTLKKSIKYHITEASVIFSRALKSRYRILGLHVESEKYKKLEQHYSKIDQAEQSAAEALDAVALIAAKHKTPNTEILENIIDILDSIKEVENSSYNLMMMVFRSRVIKANFLNNHKSAFQVYSDLNTYIKTLSFQPAKGHIFNIRNKITPSLIVAKKFDLAKDNIASCMSMRVKGEHNWHISLQHRVMLGFYSKDYDLAKSSIDLANKNEKGLAPYTKEWLKLADAYIYLLSLLDKTKYSSRFKIAKFVNEMEKLRMDKMGANVSIIIVAEFLIKLALGNRDPFIDKKESARLYVYDHLRDPYLIRAKTFLEILREVASCSFDPKEFVIRTKKQLDILKSNPITVAGLEKEIIPYEELYRMIVSILKSQSSVGKKKLSSVLVSKSY